MKLVAVTMVRDEEDVIGPVCERLLGQGVDRIIAADNLSVDGTRDILEGISGVDVFTDSEPAYYQSAKMTALARRAFREGAFWVLPFDADEVWEGCDGLTIREALYRADCDTVVARGWDHLVTDPADAPFSGWRRPEVQRLPKVAFRARADVRVEMGNHGVNPVHLVGRGVLQYHHFQYRSLDGMARKLRAGKRAYDLTELDASFGAHWREGGRLSDEMMRHKWDALAGTSGLVWDPVEGLTDDG